MEKTENKNCESGNVFLIILIGVVLFAALSFSMSRGFRTSGVSNLTKQQARLAIQDFLSRGRVLRSAIDRLRRSGCSINEISFYAQSSQWNSWAISQYDNPNAPPDESCHVFSRNGGKVNIQITFADSPNFNVFHFSNRGNIVGVGTNSADLPLVVENVSDDLCSRFNEIVNGFSDIPLESFFAGYPHLFGGTLQGSGDSAARVGDAESPQLSGKREGCVKHQQPPSNLINKIYFSLYDS